MNKQNIFEGRSFSNFKKYVRPWRMNKSESRVKLVNWREAMRTPKKYSKYCTVHLQAMSFLPYFFTSTTREVATMTRSIWNIQNPLECRGLTRATLVHPRHRASESIRCSEATVRCETRLMRRSRESNPGPLALHAKSHSNGVFDCYSEPRLVLLQLPPKPRCRKLLIGDRGWVWLGRRYIWSDAWRSE